MAEVGTLDIHGEIQALVSDKLQVVSYKWLSRNFAVTSNNAKRILQEFVEQNGSGLEIVYTLSGWLKNSPPVYHIQLVSGVKLAEIKKQFDDNCSVQVYSVQSCIPKDPAALWNSEFLQTEELFNQPSTVDNCLRDNRFCGVTNSFVKRNINEKSRNVAPQQSKTSGITISPKTTPTIPKPSPKTEKSPPMAAPVIKTEKSPSVAVPVVKNESKASNKKKPQNEKSSSGNSSLLANMWGKASVKAKPKSPEIIKDDPKPITAEAQICAQEEVEPVSSNDEDDAPCVNLKRSSNGESNRKRRMVMDFSDDDEDFETAVNLASPDPPKQSSKTSESVKNNLDFEEETSEELIVKEEKKVEKECKPLMKVDEVKVKAKSKTPETPKEAEDGSDSNKRRRVLKTRIDERGREVTEVVWEGEETEKEKEKKETVTETANNRLPEVKKSPAVASNAAANPGNKAGAKKGGKAAVKDPKQGNIMSFFKKV